MIRPSDLPLSSGQVTALLKFVYGGYIVKALRRTCTASFYIKLFGGNTLVASILDSDNFDCLVKRHSRGKFSHTKTTKYILRINVWWMTYQL